MAIQQGSDDWAEEPLLVQETSDLMVAELIAHASLRQPTLSMDDCYPEEMFWVSAGWFATAIMVWREYRDATA